MSPFRRFSLTAVLAALLMGCPPNPPNPRASKPNEWLQRSLPAAYTTWWIPNNPPPLPPGCHPYAGVGGVTILGGALPTLVRATPSFLTLNYSATPSTQTFVITNTSPSSSFSVSGIAAGQPVDLDGDGTALFSDFEPDPRCSFLFVNQVLHGGTVLFDGSTPPRTNTATLSPPVVLGPGESIDVSIFVAQTLFQGRVLVKDPSSVILVEIPLNVAP